MKKFFTAIHYGVKPDLSESLLKTRFSLFALPYAKIVAVRNFLYDKNILKAHKSGAYTISVGNLTTGGVGKTPFVKEVANFYAQKGKKVAIISRGYGGTLSNKSVNVISDGNEIFYCAKEAGDEPFWLAQNCPGVCVLTCKDKVKSAKFAVKEFGCEIVVADDAFQHRRLYRDKDIVLCDGSKVFGNKKLLPFGPLREPLSEIKRASVIVVTNKSDKDENSLKLCEKFERETGKRVFLCKMLPTEYYDLKTGAKVEPGQRVEAFCAIGNPDEFFEVTAKNFVLCKKTVFDDHHVYTERDLQHLVKSAENNYTTLVTTEKDAVKIKDMFSELMTRVGICVARLRACADFEDILR